MIYLDNAATTFMKPPSVKQSVIHAMNAYSSPGRGGYKYAMDAADMSLKCRESAAELFGVDDPEKVIFTFNATHGLNMAISSLVSGNDKVVISGYEHNSVVRPLYAIGAKIIEARSQLFNKAATIESFKKKIDSETKAVVCNHVSNVFGFVLPIEEICDICHSRGVPIIIDASQSAGVIDINVSKLGADFIAMPGHKGLYGPQGTGLLLCLKNAKPFMHGGTGSNSLYYMMPEFLPDRLEAGTHNIPGIAGLLAGLEFIKTKGTKRIFEYEHTLIKEIAAGFNKIPGVTCYLAEDKMLQSGVISFVAEGISPEYIGEKLGEMGIAVRTGLHCSPLAHKTVGTVKTGTVRVSVSVFNTKAEINSLINSVNRIINKR